MHKSVYSFIVILMFSVSCLFAESGEESMESVVQHYGAIVHASYEDSVTEAKVLLEKVEALIEAPSEHTLAAARKQWIKARLPYLQTEVYRFYDGPIDDENGPEGLLNAWPMDEAYVDYVEGQPDSGIINNVEVYPSITVELIEALNEKEGEENISAGYHAIEFLLWGQDLSAEGPGERPYTDFTSAKHADRRKDYLLATTQLLITHLEQLVEAWAPGKKNYRSQFESNLGDSVKSIFKGVNTLAGFELAGERLLVAYESQAQEDEHSCFSDTTHNDMIYDIQGILNVWTGRYERIDGTVLQGAGMKSLIEKLDPAKAEQLSALFFKALKQAKAIPTPFDQALIGKDDAPGRQAIMALVETLEKADGLMKQLSGKREFNLLVID